VEGELNCKIRFAHTGCPENCDQWAKSHLLFGLQSNLTMSQASTRLVSRISLKNLKPLRASQHNVHHPLPSGLPSQFFLAKTCRTRSRFRLWRDRRTRYEWSKIPVGARDKARL
jgi:hypothetical protein